MKVRAIRDHFDGVYRKQGEEFEIPEKPSKHVEVLDDEEDEQPAPRKKGKASKEPE